jgi:hypothetical protein
MDACEGSRASRRGGVAASRHGSSVARPSRTGLRLAPHPPNLGVGHRSSVLRLVRANEAARSERGAAAAAL